MSGGRASEDALERRPSGGDTTVATVHLRPGTEADAERLAEVRFEAIVGTAAGFYPPEVIEGWALPVDDGRREQFRRALAGEDESFLVAEHAEALVGFGSLVVSLHEFRSLYVHPRFGRRGIGGAILRELEQLASCRGLSTLL